MATFHRCDKCNRIMNLGGFKYSVNQLHCIEITVTGKETEHTYIFDCAACAIAFLEEIKKDEEYDWDRWIKSGLDAGLDGKGDRK